MTYYFSTPHVAEGPMAYNPLHIRFKINRGITVINEGGVYRETRYPSQEELQAATKYYLGGIRYEVTSAEKASLEAAGYTVETV